MNGLSILVDTNILVYLTTGNKNIQRAIHGNQISVSFITEMELMSWPANTLSQQKLVRDMLNRFRIIELSEAIKLRSIEIRRKTKLKLPDAIVAATAIENDLPLLTADQAFRKVSQLELLLLSI